MEISVVLEPTENGGYIASMPSLPGCYAQGKNKEEALQNFRKALTLHLELDDERVPVDKPGVFVEKIEV